MFSYDLALYPLLDMRCTEDGAFFVLLRALTRTRYIGTSGGGGEANAVPLIRDRMFSQHTSY